MMSSSFSSHSSRSSKNQGSPTYSKPSNSDKSERSSNQSTSRFNRHNSQSIQQQAQITESINLPNLNNLPRVESIQVQQQNVMNNSNLMGHKRYQSQEYGDSQYLNQLAQRKSLNFKSISILMKSASQMSNIVSSIKKRKQEMPTIDQNEVEKPKPHNPILDHQNELKKQMVQRRQTRYLQQHQHLIGDDYDEDEDYDDPNAKNEETSTFKQLILNRKINNSQPQFSQTMNNINQMKNKKSLVQQLQDKIQKNTEVPHKKKNIYQDFFKKMIYNRGDKNSSIENKLEIFKKLNTYINCQQQLQQINRIYNMGSEQEQKVTTAMSLQKVRGLRKNTQKFFEFYIKKDDEDDWGNERYLQKQNNAIAKVLRNEVNTSILQTLDQNNKRKGVRNSYGQRSQINAIISNRRASFYKLFNYDINTRKDAQRIYDQLLNDHKHEIQKILIKFTEYDNSKCKYEKKNLSEKLLKYWENMQSDEKYKMAPGYQELKEKIVKLQKRVEVMKLRKEYKKQQTRLLKEQKEKEEREEQEKLDKFEGKLNETNGFQMTNDKFFKLPSQITSPVRKMKSTIKEQEDIKVDRISTRQELQSNIHSSIQKILGLNDPGKIVSDLEQQSTQDIIIKNQEKLMQQVKGKKLLKDDQIIQLINDLMKNTQQIFQIGFNKYLVQENKKELANEKKKLNWDKIFQKLSQEIINNTVKSSRKIYKEIQLEKKQDLYLNEYLFQSLNNIENKPFDTKDINLLRKYLIKQMKEQNVNMIQKERINRDKRIDQQYQ